MRLRSIFWSIMIKFECPNYNSYLEQALIETGEKGEKENDHTEMIWLKIDFSISGKKEWMRLESDDYYRISSGCRVFRLI